MSSIRLVLWTYASSVTHALPRTTRTCVHDTRSAAAGNALCLVIAGASDTLALLPAWLVNIMLINVTPGYIADRENKGLETFTSAGLQAAKSKK